MKVLKKRKGLKLFLLSHFNVFKRPELKLNANFLKKLRGLSEINKYYMILQYWNIKLSNKVINVIFKNFYEKKNIIKKKIILPKKIGKKEIKNINIIKLNKNYINIFNMHLLFSLKCYKGLNKKNWIGSSLKYCSFYFKKYDFFSLNLSYSLFILKKVYLILSNLILKGNNILFINKFFNEKSSDDFNKIVKKVYQSSMSGWVPGLITNYKRIARYGMSSFFSKNKKKNWTRSLYFINKMEKRKEGFRVKLLKIEELEKLAKEDPEKWGEDTKKKNVINKNLINIFLIKFLIKKKITKKIAATLKYSNQWISKKYMDIVYLNLIKNFQKRETLIEHYFSTWKFKRRLRKNNNNIRILSKKQYWKKKYEVRIKKINKIKWLKYLCCVKKIFLKKVKYLKKGWSKKMNIKYRNIFTYKRALFVKVKHKYVFFKGYRAFLRRLKNVTNQFLKSRKFKYFNMLKDEDIETLERSNKKKFLKRRITIFPSIVILLSPHYNSLSLYESKCVNLCTIGLYTSSLKDINLSYAIPSNNYNWNSTSGLTGIFCVSIKKGLFLQKKLFIKQLNNDKNKK